MNAKSILLDHHIQPYMNRVMILEYMDRHKHASADEIYKSVKQQNSVLSKMTVYNVLKLFCEKGLIREITINDKGTRYDTNTMDHAHFKCRECGQIIDFEADMADIRLKLPKGYSVDQRDLFFYGLCDECQKKIKIARKG